MKKPITTIRGHTIPWYSDRELLEIFYPDCREVIAESIKSLEQEIKKQEGLIIKLQDLVNKSNTDEFTKYFCRELIKMEHISELMEHDRYLRNLKRYWNLLNPSYQNTYVTNFQEKIEQARVYPIYEVASRFIELVKNGKDWLGLCPFHSEKHASFRLYSDGHYHCYGCGAHGDVIKLTQELYNVDFKGAIEILTK
jgi:hypothetical protein